MLWKVGESTQQNNETTTDMTTWKHIDNNLCQSAVMKVIFFASSCVLFSSVLNIQQSGNTMKNWFHLLNNDQHPCTCGCYYLFLAWQRKRGIFLCHILTVNKSWMYLFDPKLKQQNDQSWSSNSPHKETAQCNLECSESDMCLVICILDTWFVMPYHLVSSQSNIIWGTITW